MISLILKNFLRSNSVKIGVLFILLAGMISLFVGKQFIDKQQKSVVETALHQKEHIARNVKNHQDEIGLLLYYLKFSLVNNTLPINALSIGQRDVNPSVQSVTIRALEAQKYDSDLNNPSNLLLGNIDFSFVLIFLFPLLIIAFTYNIISEEKESGTWKIVMIQSQSPFLFILQLFTVRFFVVLLVLIITLFSSIIFLKIPLDSVFWTYLITSILYILFWFGVCFWVASLQKSSNFNTVLLLSIWIFLIIILPASINNYLINKYPTPEALETTLKQRKGYHEKWDMDKQATVDKFFKHYPQFNKFKMPEGDFNWLWYYAMQQMGDDESQKQSQDLRQKLQKRHEASVNIAQFVPTIHLQIQLNELAKSGLQNQVFFLDEMTKFHEKNRLYFYPKIFSEASVNSENWNKFEVQIFTDKSSINYLKLFIPLLVFILLFGAFGWVNFKQEI
jgi:ABC-2 type transport system permease protein